MTYYKGFDKDLKCRGFQYEVGKEYETDDAKLCECGFHACEAPLDTFHYYAPNDSRYAAVELGGVSPERDSEDTKVTAKKIKIGAELNLFGLAKAHVEWVKSHIDNKKKETNTGARSAATNTGYQSAATVSGKDSVAIATGFESKARGAIGCAIIVAERGPWNGKTYPLLAICSAIVDGEKIKADTWYTAKNGNLVEVTEE